jgi:hypothetical protein
MAKHDVGFALPERQLGKADAVFKVKENGKLLGTLTMSNGSVVWFPSGTTYGCKMSWGKLDAVMKAHATRYEKR